jgi:hypothetical protein
MFVDLVLRPTVETFDLDGMAFIIVASRSEAGGLLGHAHSVRPILFPESYRKHYLIKYRCPSDTNWRHHKQKRRSTSLPACLG